MAKVIEFRERQNMKARKKGRNNPKVKYLNNVVKPEFPGYTHHKGKPATKDEKTKS